MIKNRTYLKNIACISAGKNAPKDDMFNNSNGLPFIRASHLNNLVLDSNTINRIPKVSLDIAQNLKLNIAPKGSILFAKSGMSATMNRVIKLDTDSYFVNHLACVKSNQEKLDSDYLKHFLHFYNPSNLIQGEAYPSINLNVISDLEIPLPPLSTQKAIAEKLDKADTLRKKDQELLAQYDELSQAVFIDMFGDPVKNEKGWEIKKLKNLSSKILSGNTPKGGSSTYTKKGIMFFRSQNVWKNKLDLKDIAFIDEETHEKMKNSSLMHKDILMTKTGRINTENSSLGRAALFLGDDNSANINGHVYLIRLDGKIIHEFILYILISKSYRDYIRSVCVGGIDKRQLNKDHIENFPIIYPPINLQLKYAEIFGNIEEQKALVKQQAQQSEDLFQALLQESFSF